VHLEYNGMKCAIDIDAEQYPFTDTKSATRAIGVIRAGKH